MKPGRPKEGKFAMVEVSHVPVRAQASDRSEMVTQLLFGECVEILRSQGKNWRKVRCLHDDYEGWVDPKMLLFLDEKQVERLRNCESHSIELSSSIYNDSIAIPIVMGSSLHSFDGINVKLPMGRFTFNGQSLQINTEYNRANMLLSLAKKYLHAPYLWGGRSPYGIDCSGFTQIVYKMIGIALPRDAKDQINLGQTVDFVEQSQTGDLAFFQNKEGVIHHVGIVIPDRKIIHASGKVRIDHLDHQGIYRKKRQAYTHRLRVIKRILG